MTARRLDLRLAPAPAMGDTAYRLVVLDRAEGERLLQRQGLSSLRAALSDASSVEAPTGWSHFRRGYALQFEDLALARAEWLAAEARFADEGDTSGLDMAACGLIQCTLFDAQSHAGFEERAKRMEQMSRPQDERTPLALFGLAARLLLTSERRESVEGVTDDIECAFAALRADLDREIALRVATAALPMPRRSIA